MGKLLGHQLLRRKIKTELIQKMPFRWHMSIIMFMTISLGMLSNFLLLKFLHIDQPLFRYPLTAAVSYIWFFIMIKVYMKFHEFFDGPDNLDVLDLDIGGHATHTPSPYWKGGGGEFSGGGSSGSWGSKSSSGGIDLDVDDGAGLAILVVGIIVAAIFGSSIYVIWQSPEILSEVLIEVFLVARLGKTIRKKNDPEWMMHVFKTTGLAFGFVLLVCIVGGSVLAAKCPGAKRISDISRTCTSK